MNKILNILVGCEYSGTITDAFRALNHNAWSCDLLPCEGKNPQYHYQMDVFEAIKLQEWDLAIFHPSCQYLAVSGARWMYNKDGSINQERLANQEAGLEFVRKLMAAPIKYIAIENPVSVISSKIRKPDQIIEPFWFGDSARKKTCLWLKNLPQLKPTNIVSPGDVITFASGRKMSKWMAESRGNGHLRSKTFPGIASAIADQWGQFVSNNFK